MNPLSALLNLFVPKVCHLCGTRLTPDEEFICTPCLQKLPVTGYEKYWTAPSVTPNSDLNPMEQRFAGQIPLGRACAPFFYSRDSKLATLVHDFKYRGFSRLAATLGALGARNLKDSGLFSGVDCLIPVPLHWTRQWKRGYNQSEMIASGVSAVTAIPTVCCLKAVKAHRTQTALTSQQRIANTQGIFKVTDADSIQGKHVLLVDDICTTGATLLAAAEAVARATGHNVRISVFTLGVVS